MPGNNSEEIQAIREHILDIYRLLERNTVVLEKNTESLVDHIRRTELLEKQMETALIPIRWGRWTAAVLGVLGTLAAIYQVFTHKP